MPLNSTQLNLLGTKFYVFASIVLAAAAEIEAASENSSDSNLKDMLSDKADYLNICGSELVLLSDIILGAASYAEVDENSDTPISLATRLDLFSVWVSILSDIIDLTAVIEAAKS